VGGIAAQTKRFCGEELFEAGATAQAEQPCLPDSWFIREEI
jgi:hypothetical protein